MASLSILGLRFSPIYYPKVMVEWPKILLTRAHDGLFYLDHTLKDEDAAEHFLVSLGGGPTRAWRKFCAWKNPI